MNKRPKLTLDSFKKREEKTETSEDKLNLNTKAEDVIKSSPVDVQKTKTNESPKKKEKKLLMPKEEFQEKLKYLQTKYPKCFTTPPSPLAIGIHKELISLEKDYMSTITIRNIFKIYTKSKEYRKNHLRGKDRLNLDGTVHSQVTDEQMENFKQKYKATKKKNSDQPKPEKKE